MRIPEQQTSRPQDGRNWALEFASHLRDKRFNASVEYKRELGLEQQRDLVELVNDLTIAVDSHPEDIWEVNPSDKHPLQWIDNAAFRLLMEIESSLDILQAVEDDAKLTLRSSLFALKIASLLERWQLEFHYDSRHGIRFHPRNAWASRVGLIREYGEVN